MAEYIKIDKNTFPTPFNINVSSYSRGWNACLNSVLQHKTADVVEVRHGYWKEETEYYADDYSECNVRKVFACSICGRTEKRKELYCHCGAKMDGKEKEKRTVPRCRKCVYEMCCSRDRDNDNTCPDYKRDPPDGGYYG